MNNKIIHCGNCGKIGHTYRRCLAPIMSLGVILYKLENGEIKYLFVQRRDTLGYVEFMRGKYNLENIEYICEIFKIMTKEERNKIMNNDFDTLWYNLWMDKNNKKFHNEYSNSKNKFNKLKNGYEENNKYLSLEEINNNIEFIYNEAEWGFPKGRRNLKESDIDCAVREFEEESGYEKSEYIIEDTNIKFQEIFSGTNNIRYKHIYYLAKCLNKNKILNVDKNKFSQYSEINCIKWFNYQDGLKNIRDYNLEKKEILKKVNDYILSLKNNII